jgi:4'-phosphopantetheinyl transferase
VGRSQSALKLEPGAVHVWEADLREVPEELTALLSAAERERAATALPMGPRRLWPRSRALLRLLLARYTGTDPGALKLESGRRGKPHLGDGTGPHFNLSHSGSMALYAFSAHGPVGIDVEREGARSRVFLRRWTRHEATLKCLGDGLGAPGRAGFCDGDAAKGTGLWIGELDLGPGATGAIACHQAPRALELFSWVPREDA